MPDRTGAVQRSLLFSMAFFLFVLVLGALFGGMSCRVVVDGTPHTVSLSHGS